MNPRVVLALCSVVLASTALGCGNVNANRDAGRRPPVSMTPSVRSSRGATPPTGATSSGMMTRPAIATGSSLTVPVTDAEVFTFSCTPEGATAAVSCSWAYDATTTRNYLWWSQSESCASSAGSSDSAFLMEINADGSGGFLLTSTCGDINLTGCQYDTSGALGACGVCSLGDTGLVACAQ